MRKTQSNNGISELMFQYCFISGVTSKFRLTTLHAYLKALSAGDRIFQSIVWSMRLFKNKLQKRFTNLIQFIFITVHNHSGRVLFDF